MKKYLLSIIFIFTTNFVSAEELYPCDSSCPSLFSEASNLASSLPNGTVFSVIDVENDVAQTYQVEHYYNRAAGEYLERAKQITTTSKALSTLNDMKAIKSSITTTSVNIPEDIADSAHDIILSPTVKNKIADMIYSESGLIDKVGSLAGFFISAFGKKLDITVYMEVYFSDGSSARYKVTGLNSSSVEFEYMEGTATDSDGNKIPSDPSQFAGRHDFSRESNLDGFSAIADMMNIENNRQYACADRVYITCSNTGSSYSCTSYTTCH